MLNPRSKWCAGAMVSLAVAWFADSASAYNGCCQRTSDCRNDYFGIFCVWAGWTWDPREYCDYDTGSCEEKPRPAATGRCTGATLGGLPACFETTSSYCATAGGTYGGDGTSCPEGACTYNSENCCLVVSREECQIVSGVYAGDATTCSLDLCTVDPIPAVSEWGVVMLTGILLTSGTLVLRRQSF